MSFIIRPAEKKDLPAILAIYNQVIATSTAIYDDDPVTLESREHWLKNQQEGGFPILVAVDSEEVTGYASYGPFRSKPGYRYTVEHSVHIAENQRGTGIGSALMDALLTLSSKTDIHAIIGVIDAENSGSLRFHERFGFKKVGHFPEVGFKFGRWLDAVFMQKTL